MSSIKINFEKPSQEFEINGKIYEVFYDDESLKKYEKVARRFFENVKTNIDIEKISDSERDRLEKENIEEIKLAVEAFFGEGKYEEIYEASGKSLINMTTVISVVFDWIEGKLKVDRESAINYYTGNKTQKARSDLH